MEEVEDLVARPRSVNVRDLRTSNRARALSAIYMDGPMTRQDVAAAAGVSPATVSNVVGELLEQGVLVEVGVEDSDGGRPRALLQVDARYGYVIGVDVGETAVLAELFDLRLQVLASHTATPRSAVLDPDSAAELVGQGIAAVLAEPAVSEDTILGIGIGVPGLVEHGADAVVHAQTIGWNAVPFGAMLRRRTDLPLLIDNGAKALGQAETWFGAARTSAHAVIALLGTGVGTSIITDGELYRGPSSSAGEWGHTTVVLNGRRCRCGAAGCLEAYVGARAVADRYRELGGSGPPAPDGANGTNNGGGSGEDLEGTIAGLAAAGRQDRAAAQVLEETATYLGAGIADLINLFNPERIVVGGWLGLELGERLLPRVRDVAAEHALKLPFSQVSIVAAKLGTDAVALGAATLPISQFLATGASSARARQGSRRRSLV